MTQLLVMALLVSSHAGQSAFEKAEQRLAELLTVGTRMTFVEVTAQPIAWRQSRGVEELSVPIKPVAGVSVRLPLIALKEVKPAQVPEGKALVSYRDESEAPESVQLPTKPLIKLPSLDVHTPIAIPILAQPAKDRASLAEPAFDASLNAVMKPFSATRDRPVPFVPVNIPDPFEHARHGQMQNPPLENPVPPIMPLTRPVK